MISDLNYKIEYCETSMGEEVKKRVENWMFRSRNYPMGVKVILRLLMILKNLEVLHKFIYEEDYGDNSIQ